MLPLLVLAAATLLPADLADDEAFQAGLRHRNALEYEAALGAFERALAADPARPAVERAELLLYAGVLSAELRRFDDARAHFREALTLVPDLTLALDVSPTIRQLFDEVRTELAAARPPAPAPPVEPPPVEREAPAAESVSAAEPAAGLVPERAAPNERAELASAELSPWGIAAIGTLATGGLVTLGGLAAWGGAVVWLYAPVDGVDYQSEVAKRNAESATLQLVGQGVAVVGAVLLGVGALFLVGE